MSDFADQSDSEEPLDASLLRAFASEPEPLPSGAFLAQLVARLQREQRRAAARRIALGLCLAVLAGWLLTPLAASVSLRLSGQALGALPQLDQLALTPVGSLLLVLAFGAGWRLLRR
ncbi:MAG TPA: hypothetical protein VME21_08930 [Steroidobacteraceae bacterium]|nr:hypothetical protein [Steroidobacteraceae bacterium]